MIFEARREHVAYLRSNGYTYREIGKRMGISPQRVMQILNNQRRRTLVIACRMRLKAQRDEIGPSWWSFKAK